MAVCKVTSRFVRIAFNILSLWMLFSSAMRFNVYQHYYLEDSCAFNKTVEYKLEATGMRSTAKIGLSRDGKYTEGRNCSVTIRPPLGYGVILYVDSFAFGNLYYCNSEFIEISEGSKSTKLCGYKHSFLRTTFTTEGPMNISYRTYDTNDFKQIFESLNNGDFKLIATAYKKGVLGFSACNNYQFECPNRQCIWNGLTCDNVNNCGDNSDEDSYGSSKCRIPEIVTIPPLVDWTFVMPDIDFKPYTITTTRTSQVTVGAAVASVVLIILGAMIRFFCYYQCAEQRRREAEITGVAVIRTRRAIISPFRQPPPPYTSLVNEVTGRSGAENISNSDNPPTYSETIAETQPGSKKGYQPSACPTEMGVNSGSGNSHPTSASGLSAQISTPSSSLSSPVSNASVPVLNSLAPPIYEV